MGIGLNKRDIKFSGGEQPTGEKDDVSEVDSLDNLEHESDEGGAIVGFNSKKILGISLIVVVVLILLIAVATSFINRRKKNETAPEVEVTDASVSTSPEALDNTEGGASEYSDNPNAVYNDYGEIISENGIYDLDGNVIDDNAIDPGIKDYASSDRKTTTPYVYEADDFIKDLNGLDVSAVYNVRSRNYVVDYVSYTPRRAVIDDGMELYWIEVTYRDKKYRVQVPFYYFKDLMNDDICKVEMEVLTLEGGGKIISYMQVVNDDYSN